MMKKITLILSMAIVTITAQAIPLFPFFTDVAGDFKDGTTEELTKAGITCQHYAKPSFYKTLAEADAFLKDVLPFSNETINRTEINKDGIKTVIYTSPMTDGQTSTLYLVEIPQKGFYAAYNEGKPDLKKAKEETKKKLPTAKPKLKLKL